MFLLIGLGNFGKEYTKTRHNFGFMAIDYMIEQHSFNATGKKFSSEIFTGEIANKKIIALKPQTYMNLSGKAVLEAVQFYKIPTQNIIVLHDEIDLPLGTIRTKIGGGNAGHNGLKSIDSTIGKEYWRIRLGVGRPQNAEFEIADYVLSKFTQEESFIVEKTIKDLDKIIIELFSK